MEDRCIMKQRTLVTLLIIETVILAFVLLGKVHVDTKTLKMRGTIVQIFHGTFQDKQKFLEKNHQMANTL